MKKMIVLVMLLGLGNAYAADSISGEYNGSVSSTWSRTNGAPCSLYIDLSRGYFSIGAGSTTSGNLGGFAFTTKEIQLSKLMTPESTVLIHGNPDGYQAALELKTDSNGQLTSYNSSASKNHIFCAGLQKVQSN